MDDPLIVGIRWGLYLTLSVVFGVPLFALHAVAPNNRDGLQLRVLVGLSAAAALAFSLLGWVTMTATMAGKPLGGVDRDDLMAMIAMPGLGTSWLLRIASLVLLVIAASIAVFGRTLPVVGTMLGAIALGFVSLGRARCRRRWHGRSVPSWG